MKCSGRDSIKTEAVVAKTIEEVAFLFIVSADSMQLPSLPCASLTSKHPGRLDQPVSDLPLVAANHSDSQDSPGIFVKPLSFELSYFPEILGGFICHIMPTSSSLTRSKSI